MAEKLSKEDIRMSTCALVSLKRETIYFYVHARESSFHIPGHDLTFYAYTPFFFLAWLGAHMHQPPEH